MRANLTPADRFAIGTHGHNTNAFRGLRAGAFAYRVARFHAVEALGTVDTRSVGFRANLAQFTSGLDIGYLCNGRVTLLALTFLFNLTSLRNHGSFSSKARAASCAITSVSALLAAPLTSSTFAISIFTKVRRLRHHRCGTNHRNIEA